jgi:hypothetical protein
MNVYLFLSIQCFNVLSLIYYYYHQGPPIGINTPLVDSEGYPRSDIDVFRARTLRKRFIEIQNDHKAVQAKIERGLSELQLVVVRTCVVCVFVCVECCVAVIAAGFGFLLSRSSYNCTLELTRQS